MDLEREHEELLALLVEAARSVPRDERHPFLLAKTMGGDFLVHDGLPEQPKVSEGDLKDLAEAGFLRRGMGSRGTPNYEVRQQGFAYYDQIKRHQAGRIEHVEGEIRRYLDTRAIPSAYQASLTKWRRADGLLWSAGTEDQLTNIGHICREAMQDFAQAMTERLQPPGAGSLPRDPQKTVSRIRSCIKHLGSRTGQHEAAWLEALLAYWGTVSDLAQRQEHGAGKEGEDLVWEDARRLVFHTVLVMFELVRAVERRRP
jgi:hypothetical protein